MMLAASTPIFYDGADQLVRVLITVVILYAATVAMIRISGKRSTSQMNNFDWIVTVAIGSMIASPILLDDVTIVESLVAIGMMFLLQWIVTKLIVRSRLAARVFKAKPTLLLYRGEFDREAMKRERVSESEIIGAIREHGFRDHNEIDAVVLESDAKLSVIPANADSDDPKTDIPSLSDLR